MKLDKNTVAGLALPDGKSDAIFFDEGLPGFGGPDTGRAARRFGSSNIVSATSSGANPSAMCARLSPMRRARRPRGGLAAVLLGSDPAADKAAAKVKNKRTLGAVSSNI